MRIIASTLLAAASVAVLAGCSCLQQIPRDPVAVCHGDRCHIEDAQFVRADKMYAQSGSIALVERQLRENLQWRDCEVNEAIYRLRKVHSLP